MDLVEMDLGAARRHPWEEARGRFFSALLRGRGLVGGDRDVLDVGAGDAWFARKLAAGSPAPRRIACWDSGYTPELLARVAAGAPPSIAFGSARPAGRFSLVILLDVLEHVEDDRGFLAALVREGLADGGHVLVSVPAWPSLTSSHDAALGHRRRYRPRDARALLAGAGLEPVISGGLFGTLLPLRAAQTLRERISRPGPAPMGAWSGGARLTAFVRAVLSWDARVSLAGARLGVALPGLSFWALCRRSR